MESQLSTESRPTLHRLAKQGLVGLCQFVCQGNMELTTAARCLVEALKRVIVLRQAWFWVCLVFLDREIQSETRKSAGS